MKKFSVKEYSSGDFGDKGNDLGTFYGDTIEDVKVVLLGRGIAASRGDLAFFDISEIKQIKFKLVKAERELVFNKYNGKCAYCGCDLQKGWHADHIEPIVRNWTNGTCEKPENHNIQNFNPSCASCNIQKSSLSLEQFRSQIKQFVNSLNQYSTQYKFAKRYGLVEETEIEVKFYFEKL